MKDKLAAVLILAMFIALTLFCVYKCTGKSAWYNDKHDSMCELGQEETCHCYERFMKKH